MGRKANDGRGRLGGRKKGTPNKPMVTLGDWVSELVDKNRSQLEKDLKECSPYERASILANLARFDIYRKERTQ